MKKFFNGLASHGAEHASTAPPSTSSAFPPPSGPPQPYSGNTYSNSAPPPQQYSANQYTTGPQYAAQQQQQQVYGANYNYHNAPAIAAGTKPTSAGAVGSSQEDPLNALRKYDTVILVDDSGSMYEYWAETRVALAGVVRTSIPYDANGVDVYFFNEPNIFKTGIRSVEEVDSLFNRIDPYRSTPTANAIHRLLTPYVQELEQAKQGGQQAWPKPMNLIVLTDGEPDRGQDPEPVLVDVAKRLDTIRAPLYQLGVNFIQIGNDEAATRHLKMLDDDLKTKHKVRDFVDTTPFQASTGGHITTEFIIKALLGGINRRVDKE